MALADPQTVTISGTTTSLPRVSVDETESEYLSSDGLIKLLASHTYGKRTRRLVRIDHAKLAADVFKPTENVKVGMAVYTVFDLPPAGYTGAEALAVWTGFNTQLTAASNAVVTKILGGES
ncbi:TPA_asm: coat protein [ssRNA phage Zoerhiza.1_3]|uniref:Coat protein n=3 Tax=Leviviricetes TaxID=2842243 RepID=A0A8S5KZ72_9VIRU|nr:coat protein [ssRNA phage Zoerhiza.1_3]QDH87930.1 MAG: hypothetical protein H1Rhizo25438_000002 [Leviviridae sp.]DAD50499.1 TPA_asm: coat protein [ssRNA phage Zoerhiza.1_3]